MKRNNVITVTRITLGLIGWFLTFQLYRIFVDPQLDGMLPGTVRRILASMVVPYTLGIAVFYLIVHGMPCGDPAERKEIQPGAGIIAKFFVIQTGLSFPVMVAANIAMKVAGVESHGITAEDLFGHVWFYIVLLLIFNPIFEELLFRKLVLYRLIVLGEKGAILVSAVLFALPHVYSQGVPQMCFTFAAGLVWAHVTIKTGTLLPAIVLHALSNIYCAYVPILLNLIHPMLSVVYMVFTISVMVPMTIVLIKRQRKGSNMQLFENAE